MFSATCPVCVTEISVSSNNVGAHCDCEFCDAKLEVFSANAGVVFLKVRGLPSKTGTCPECEGNITLKRDVLQGEIVVCGDCGVDLEVVTLTPTITLALAPQEAEDWGE